MKQGSMALLFFGLGTRVLQHRFEVYLVSKLLGQGTLEGLKLCLIFHLHDQPAIVEYLEPTAGLHHPAELLRIHGNPSFHAVGQFFSRKGTLDGQVDLS